MMSEVMNPYYVQIGMFVFINAILGLSIYMTLATGQLSLGNAGFMSLGAYTSAICSMNGELPIGLSILLGGLVAALVALVIGIPTTRLQGLYLAIATLGFGEVVRVIALNLDITHGALGLSGIPSLSQELGLLFFEWGVIEVEDGSAFGDMTLLVLLGIIVGLMVLFWVRLMHSRIGRAFAAIKADEQAAELMGIETVYYKMMAFVMGSFFAGIGGALYAHATFFINPSDFSYHKVVDILLFAVFGGSTVVGGPILGAAVLTVLPELLRFMAEYREMVYGALLVLLMVLRPEGIWVKRSQEKGCFGIERYIGRKKGDIHHVVTDEGSK